MTGCAGLPGWNAATGWLAVAPCWLSSHSTAILCGISALTLKLSGPALKAPSERLPAVKGPNVDGKTIAIAMTLPVHCQANRYGKTIDSHSHSHSHMNLQVKILPLWPPLKQRLTAMEQDFSKTGDQATKTGPMRLGSVLTFPGPLKTSGITGSPKQALPPARPIGAALGVSGPDELPTIYDHQPSQGRVVVSVLTLLKQASSQLHGSEKSANLQIISDCKAALEAALKPQEPERLSARITTFLAHWFLPDMTAAIRSAMIGDWLDEFDDVPGWALDFALKLYFATNRKKPFPVDINALLPPEFKWGSDTLDDLNRQYL